MQTDASKLMNIGTASEYLGVSIDTLRRWEKKGKLEVFRSPGGHRYFHKDDLDKLFGKKYERAEETRPRKRKVQEKEIIEKEPDKSEVKNEEKPIEVVKEPVKETILDRPTREVKIPEVTFIRVKQDIQPPQMIQNDTQSSSVLTPVVTPAEAPASPPPVPQNAEPKKEMSKEKADSKTIALILGGIGVVVILVALFIWWQSSQRILSPVP